MGEATVSFQVDEELGREFAAVAESRQRSGEDLLREYMREVVQEREEAAEYDAWFRREVQKGIDDVEAGRVVSAEEAARRMRAFRAEVLQRRAQEADV